MFPACDPLDRGLMLQRNLSCSACQKSRRAVHGNSAGPATKVT